MKYKNLLLLVAALIASKLLFATPVEPVRTMDVPMADTPPALDGLLEGCYGEMQSTTWIYPEQLSTWDGEADFKADFALSWDQDYLYVYTEVMDDVEHDFEWEYGSEWMFDNFFLYIQLDTNTVETFYGPNTVSILVNRGLDSVNWSGHAGRKDFGYYMEASTASGWLTEMAVPWTAVYSEGDTPEDIMDYIGVPIGFDFQGGDSDNAYGDETIGSRDFMTSWDLDGQDGTEDLAWNNTSVFGYITLLEGSNPGQPIADAGPDQTVDEGDLVTLDGTGSSDPDGGDLTYTWYPHPGITLSDIHVSQPTFTAPQVTSNMVLTFGLLVNDGTYNSGIDYVIVNVQNVNLAPVAVAGSDQTVNERELVMLDGSMSYDPDAQPINYVWDSPENVKLVNGSTPYPIFVAPDVMENEEFRFILTVSDGDLTSEADTMSLYVNSVGDEYDTLVIYDTVYVVDLQPLYNTIMISVTDNDNNLIAREVEGNLYVELYPNPADQYINIRSEMMIYELEICDVSGNVITNDLVNSLTAEISLGGFTAGTYILRISTESGIVTKQLILE